MEERKIDAKHGGIRTFLRIAGPVALICGVLLTVHGFTGFLSSGRTPTSGGTFRLPESFGPFEEQVRHGLEQNLHPKARSFGCIVGGFFLSGLGLMMTAWGFMGAVLRYQAAEVVPVGKDAFNYVAHGTRDGVKTVAGAIGAGLSEGMRGAQPAQPQQVLRCHKCNADNNADAKFCSQCGAALAKTKPCPGCGELNDPDARFCDSCGHHFA